MAFARLRGRGRLALAGAVAVLGVAVLVVALSGSGEPPLPLPGIGRPARAGDPFAYSPSRQSEFEARATAGSAHVLFTKSPGGAIATAARVAAFRGLIDRATAGTRVDPNMLEALVFLESAGRPDVIAGPDPAAAAGLTQILAETGQALLGMHIDLATSRKLTRQIVAASDAGDRARVARLERARAKIDDRFDPGKALAATVRYLELSRRRFGRSDLAIESYHMGIGNLQRVLDLYDGGHPAPYAQLYFDSSPSHNASAFALLSSFSDDSSLYYWRLLGAAQIMRLYRSDRGAVARLGSLQSAEDSNADVLHAPDRTQTFADPDALRSAYASRTLLPLPSDAARLGLAYDPSIGSLAFRLGQPAQAYRGLRAPALDMLVELAARVRAMSGVRAPLTVLSTVTDRRYQRVLGFDDPPATTGYTFEIARRYANRAQAHAFQATLDRLQALNLVAWARGPTFIEITIASDASQAIVGGI